MWHKFMHGEANFCFSRGDIKFVILNLLKEKPKHGYEIMKDIESKMSGFYSASAGSVYPTLQMLEDQGYVKSNPVDGKKVYEITAEGRDFLQKNRETADAVYGRFGSHFGFNVSADQKAVFHETRDIIRSIINEMRHGSEVSSEQWRKVNEVMVRAHREIEDILKNPR